jgi:hypothetical protein
MQISNGEQVELCCSLAKQALDSDYWEVETVLDVDGNESYSEDPKIDSTIIMAQFGSNLKMQKIKDYAISLAAMVAGVTMGYVIFGLIIYIVWRI